MSQKPTYEELEQRIVELEKRLYFLKDDKSLFTEIASYDKILGIFPAMAHSIDSSGSIVNVSDIWLDKMGYAREEVIGRKSLDFLTSESAKYAQDIALPKYFKKGFTQNVPYQMVRKNGTIIDVLLAAITLVSPSGDFARSLAIMTDITERKKAEREILLSKTRFQALFNDSPVPLWEEDFTDVQKYLNELKVQGITDFRTHFENNPEQVVACAGMVKILNVNQATLKLHGADNREELVGNLDKIFTENSFSIFQEELIALANGLKEYETEAEVKTLTGEVRYIYLKFIVHTLTQDSAKILLATTDITEQKKNEKERQTLQAQLAQSQKMESLGTLAGGIAHDFNNILTAILGYAELAMDDVQKDSDAAHDLKEIYTAGNRAKDIVQQILVFSRKSEEVIQPVNVRVIAEEVMAFIRSSIPASIQILKRFDSDSFIMGNSTHIHQVLMNLCTNAAKAMEKTGGILEVTLRDVQVNSKLPGKYINLAPGAYIELQVIDSGEGIAPEIIDFIFEPYFTTRIAGEGTGMGLAVVKSIVESYKGKVTVKNTKDKKTVFSIYLPVTNVSIPQRSTSAEPVTGGKGRILFVDDEIQIVKLTGKMLERLGYSVVTESESQKALELFRSQPDNFDLVITDMAMPNMTGDILATEILKIRPDIPIVLCTGYSGVTSTEKAKSSGIKEFLYKPVAKDDLAKILKKVLDR